MICMALIENIRCDQYQIREILERDTCERIPPNEIQKMINFKRALEFLESESRYPVELGGLIQYNALIGSDECTHANPGCIRVDRSIHVSGCVHAFSPVLESEALHIVNGYRSYNDIFDQCAYLSVVLPKAQLFYNGNKRTSLLACNQLLCNYDAGYVFMFVTNEDRKQYIETLLDFYNNDITQREAMNRMKSWVVEIY